MPTILIKKSDTPGSVPGTANLTNLAGGAEVAVNTADRRMFTMNSSSAVVELGTNPSSLTCADGSFTLLKAASASITNLTATSLVLSNLSIASANVTTLTSASATITNLLATSLTVSGNTFLATSSGNVGIGTSSPSSVSKIDIQIGTSTSNYGLQVRSYDAGTVDGSTTARVFRTVNSGAGNWANAQYDAWSHIWTKSASSELMRLDSSGNLGIGTSSPAYPLQVRRAGGAGSLGVSIDSVGATDRVVQYFSIQDDAAGVGAGHAFYYRAPSSTTNTLGVLLDESGNLGIGTSSPAAKFHTQQAGSAGVVVGAYLAASGNGGSGRGTGLLFGAPGSSSVVDVARIDGLQNTAAATANDAALVFNVANTSGTLTERLRIDSAGNLGLGVTPSAWGSTYKMFQASSQASFGGNSSNITIVGSNYYNDGVSKYIGTGLAALYLQDAGVHKWLTAPSGTAGNAITFTQAMTLGASGNLGVGTTSPNKVGWDSNARVMTIFGPQRGAIELGADSPINSDQCGNVSFMSGTTQKAQIQCRLDGSSNGSLVFYANSATERARITSGGDLLVNTTTSYGRITAQTVDGSAAIGTIVSTAVNYNALDFRNSAGTQCGRILVNNAVTTEYLSASDRRLKENIAPADDAGSVIDSIEVVKHDWKVGGHVRFGVIAQDLHVVAPEAVGTGDTDDVEELKQPWGVDYSKLVPMLIKEVQSLRKRVAELEAK
jgi:hypothetical protein